MHRRGWASKEGKKHAPVTSREIVQVRNGILALLDQEEVGTQNRGYRGQNDCEVQKRSATGAPSAEKERRCDSLEYAPMKDTNDEAFASTSQGQKQYVPCAPAFSQHGSRGSGSRRGTETHNDGAEELAPEDVDPLGEQRRQVVSTGYTVSSCRRKSPVESARGKRRRREETASY